MLLILKRIWTGLGNTEQCGGHPGWPWAILFPVIGCIAGMPEPNKMLFGTALMFILFWPLFLWGAYDRGKIESDAR